MKLIKNDNQLYTTTDSKSMFIIAYIYSKNLTSLTNYLKFLSKLQKNKTLKLKFHVTQSQKKKNFTFFSTLQSPHVNKKSQEQFEYYKYSKKLKIHVSQVVRFLTAWKWVKTTLFSDVNIKTKFCFYDKSFNISQIDYDKFILKFNKQELKHLLHLKQKNLSNTTTQTSLKLYDIHGEILLKSLSFDFQQQSVSEDDYTYDYTYSYTYDYSYD